jgi:hypothetical protein
MVSITGNSGTAGAVSLLRSAALTADGTAASSAGGSAAAVVQQIVRDQQAQAQKNSFLRNAADAIAAVASGSLAPSTDWMKLGGYYAAKAVPFTISLDSSGQLQVTDQVHGDFSKYSADRQEKLIGALQKLQTLTPRVQAENDRKSLLNTWDSVPVLLTSDINGTRTAETPWELHAQTLFRQNVPFTYTVDDKGEVTIQDQRLPQADDDASPHVQSALRKAATLLQEAFAVDSRYNDALDQVSKGTMTSLPAGLYEEWSSYQEKAWIDDAVKYKKLGVPYYLEVDPVMTSSISVKPLTKLPIPDRIATPTYSQSELQNGKDPWLKDAADLIANGTAFMLDFDQTGNVVAKQLSAENVIRYNNPVTPLQSYSQSASLNTANPYAAAVQILSVKA